MTERHDRPLGDRPWWMSEWQYKQCTCVRTDVHDDADCFCGRHDDDREDKVRLYEEAVAEGRAQ